MAEFSYPFTIDNGGGEQITFTKRVKSPDGDYSEGENFVLPGSGPPMHVHFKQAESLTVVKGIMGSEIFGEKPVILKEGETVTYEAGVAHKFWNAGEEPLICTAWIKPAHNTEYFLSELFRSTKENGGKRPGTFDSAYLLNRYRSEFDMLEIPPFVKKVIFPVIVFFGKLAGKHKKFKDAPEPIK